MRRVAVLLAALAASAAVAQERGGSLGGWIVPWRYDAGLASLARADGAMDDVFLFAARLDDGGHPVLDARQDGWSDTVARVHAAGARAWLTIVNDRVAASGAAVLKDAELVHRVLADPQRRAGHRAEIVALAKRLKVDGVDLDYENLPPSERVPFTGFVSELAGDLRAQELRLSITVQPKSRDGASRGPGAMDWTALCRIADRLQVMLYNEHNAGTGPGPVASLDWISRVVDYGLGVCPASKLIPVLKVSGMDWGEAQADWRTFYDVTATLAAERSRVRRDWSNRVPWFTYRGSSGRHVVYFEDAKSLAAKVDRLRAKGLETIVLWSLGSEDPEAIVRLAKALGSARRQNR